MSRRLAAPLVALSLAFGLSFAAGCGGGGGGGSSPSPTNPIASNPTPVPIITPVPIATPTPVASAPSPTAPIASPGSPAPTLTPLSRAQAANYLPNYLPPVIPGNSNPDYLHWASNKNLRIYIAPPINNVRDNAPSSAIVPASAKSVTDRALAQWTNATGNDFTFTYVNDPASADITVQYVEDLLHYDTKASAGAGTVGLTYYTYIFPNNSDTARGNLNSAFVQVKSNQQYNSLDAHLVDTTAHEIGHALGIQQHSLTQGDLMFATSLADGSRQPGSLTQADQDTVFFLYYAPASVGGRAAHQGGASGVIRHGEIE